MSDKLTNAQIEDIRTQLITNFTNIRRNPWDVNSVITHLGFLTEVVDNILLSLKDDDTTKQEQS